MIKVKRRKDKYNPYTLVDNNHISFTDSKGNNQLLKISDELYNAFNQFELQDKKIMNEYDRHTEHIEQTDEMLYKKVKIINNSLEEMVINKIFYENILNEIDKLPEIEKRRLKKYFFQNKTLKEISIEEGCSPRAIKYSIDGGLKKILKNIKY